MIMIMMRMMFTDDDDGSDNDDKVTCNFFIQKIAVYYGICIFCQALSINVGQI